MNYRSKLRRRRLVWGVAAAGAASLMFVGSTAMAGRGGRRGRVIDVHRHQPTRSRADRPVVRPRVRVVRGVSVRRRVYRPTHRAGYYYYRHHRPYRWRRARARVIHQRRARRRAVRRYRHHQRAEGRRHRRATW